MRYPFTCFLLCLLSTAGCARHAAVTGRVTFEGKEVEKGTITFFPAEGTDNVQKATITKGRFAIDDLTPGMKRILVAAEPRFALARSGRGKHVRAVPSTLRAAARGNNRVVELTPGAQTLDLDLRK